MTWRIRRPRRPVEWLAPQRYALRFSDDERALVGRLVDQLRGLLTQASGDDPRTRRLFPTAYHDDPEHDGEYHRLMRDELVASRIAALDLVEQSLERTEVDEAELAGLMRSINAIRLVLGTLLDLNDDSDPAQRDDNDPLYAEYQLYLWLSWVLEHVVEALHSGLAQS